MSRSEENNRKGTLELLCLFLPSVLWLTDLSIEDGILYIFEYVRFFYVHVFVVTTALEAPN